MSQNKELLNYFSLNAKEIISNLIRLYCYQNKIQVNYEVIKKKE